MATGHGAAAGSVAFVKGVCEMNARCEILMVRLDICERHNCEEGASYSRKRNNGIALSWPEVGGHLGGIPVIILAMCRS